MAKKEMKKQALKLANKKKAKQGMKPGGPSQAHSEAVMEKVLSQRKPKTRKGKVILQSREPKVIENSKTALVIRGNRASLEVMGLLRDVHRLRHPLSVLYSRKHDTHPFENVEPVEYLCKKFDHTLFVFGSSNKKRPFRLIFGRMFSNSLLDMQEYNVSNFKSIGQVAVGSKFEATMGAKPLILFQGPAFETDERLKRTKSMLLDYFKGKEPDSVLLEGFEHCIVCTAGEPTTRSSSAMVAVSEEAAEKLPIPQQDFLDCPPVTVRRFHIAYEKSGAREPRVELTEIGPCFTLTVDRVREADRERWKQAIKVPKQLKKAKVKNITMEQMGKKRGQIHLGQQVFDNIHTVHHGKAKDRKLRADLAAKATKRATKAAPTSDEPR